MTAPTIVAAFAKNAGIRTEDPRSWRTRLRPAQLRQGAAQRSVRNPQQPVERPIQLENQEDRPGDRGGAQEQRDDRRAVDRSKQAEAPKDDRQPKDEHDQKRRRDRAASLLKEEPARLADV